MTRPLPLWRKELTQLRPWAFLSGLLGIIDPLDELTSQVDRLPLSLRFSWVVGDGLYPAWLLAFAVGMGLAVRERDDGTLAFLDGLPVRRSAVFFTRCAVAIAVVSLAPIVRATSSVVLHLLSRGSLDHALHPELLLSGLGLGLLLMVNAVLTGAALGGLRSVAWLAAGALATGLALLIDQEPRAAVLNPFALCEVTANSRGLAVDAALVWTQVGICVVSAFIAWRVFDGGTGTRLLALSRRPVVGAIIGALTIASAIAALAVIHDDKPARAAGSASPKFDEGPPAQLQTTHYRFSYPANHSKSVLELAARADDIFERVHALLHVSPGPRIDVDASGSLRNTAGTAFSDGLRLNADADDLPTVLAHETSHVIARRLAGGAEAHLWNRAIILNEGLATWVERYFQSSAAERDEGLLVLAALRHRNELPLEAMGDLDLLAARDANLKYPMGELVIEAIVEVAGEEALARVVAGFGDASLPQNVIGLELLRVVLQQAGVDLATVMGVVARTLQRETTTRTAALDALPHPRTRLVKLHGKVGAQLLLDAPLPEGWGLALRFKPAASSAPNHFDRIDASRGEVAWRTPRDIGGGRVCVQAGLTTPHDLALFEPWACQVVDDAETLDWVPTVRAHLAAVKVDAVFERPTHVDVAHPSTFGAESVSAWPALDALGTEWSELKTRFTCFDALQEGRLDDLSDDCLSVLTRAQPSAEVVAQAVRTSRSGPAAALHWTTRPLVLTRPGPRMAARTLLLDGDRALDRHDLQAAADRCLDVLALARDLEWGADAAMASEASGITGLVMPLCLRVTATAPSLLREGLTRIEAGLAPTLHVLMNEREQSEARDFGRLLDAEARSGLPREVNEFLSGLTEGFTQAQADQRWSALDAAWSEVLARPAHGAVIDAVERKFHLSSAGVGPVLRAHECRAGLLAMPRALAGDVTAVPSLTVTRSDDSVTLEVHCGVSAVSHRAVVRGTDVRWLINR